MGFAIEKILLKRTALVTGSSKKLGKHIALHLADLGAGVAIHYLSGKERAEKVVKQIRKKGVDCFAFKADLSDPLQAKKLVERVVKKFGSVDILVNNVGNYLHKPIHKTTEMEWKYILNTNLNCTFYCTKYALPFMRKKKFGRIINIGYSAINKTQAMPNNTIYYIAKTGVLLYTKSIAAEEIRNGITANVISPGHTFDSLGNRRKAIKKIPAGRLALPLDFFPVLEMIVKKESSYITGNHFVVSGGYNI